MARGVASFVLCVNVNPNIQSGFQPTAEPTGLQPVVAVSLCKERKMLPMMIMIVEWLVLGAALGPVVLILLLATRIVGFDVRSRGSNRLSVRFSPGDAGVFRGKIRCLLSEGPCPNGARQNTTATTECSRDMNRRACSSSSHSGEA